MHHFLIQDKSFLPLISFVMATKNLSIVEQLTFNGENNLFLQRYRVQCFSFFHLLCGISNRAFLLLNWLIFRCYQKIQNNHCRTTVISSGGRGNIFVCKNIRFIKVKKKDIAPLKFFTFPAIHLKLTHVTIYKEKEQFQTANRKMNYYKYHV